MTRLDFQLHSVHPFKQSTNFQSILQLCFHVAVVTPTYVLIYNIELGKQVKQQNMSPNLEGQIPESTEFEPKNDDIQLNLSPLGRLSAASSISDGSTSQTDSDNRIEVFNETEEVDIAAVSTNLIPLEYNIRELLVSCNQLNMNDVE